MYPNSNEAVVTSTGVPGEGLSNPSSAEQQQLAPPTGVYLGWPFPSWTMFDPDRTCWDSFGQRNICFFCEFADYRGIRTGLYSTLSPNGIYIIEDSGEFGSPPQVAGSPLSGDELWPRMDPSWLQYDGPYPENYAEDHGPNWLKAISVVYVLTRGPYHEGPRSLQGRLMETCRTARPAAVNLIPILRDKNSRLHAA